MGATPDLEAFQLKGSLRRQSRFDDPETASVFLSRRNSEVIGPVFLPRPLVYFLSNMSNRPEGKHFLMTSENISQPIDLNEATRMIWDQNAAFWDENMAEGNDFQRLLIGPASERLLNLQAGETVLEIACGNGVFSRRMAELGVHVIATDFSAQLLERARARTSEHTDRIEYRLLDATHEEQIVA